MEHLYYFWGWAVKWKMSHPQKLVPGKHKIGSLGFLVAAVEEIGRASCRERVCCKV